jgi:hypothetical protein
LRAKVYHVYPETSLSFNSLVYSSNSWIPRTLATTSKSDFYP